MNIKHYIGIDIGGTSTTVGLVSKAGKIVDRSIILIQDYASGPIEPFLDAMADAITELSEKHQVEISGIGIGAPNGNFYRGTIEYAPNMPWKDVHEVAPYLENKLGIRSVLTNDANAAAIGEKQFGVAKDFDDFILITLGTGLGSGIVAGGNVIYGHDGFAGELGHAIVVPDGRNCTCGRKGCLEAYVSIRGLLETYHELADDKVNTPQDIAAKAQAGDPNAIETFRKTGEWLGLKLADAATYTSPEAIIFFGGIAQSSDLFFPALKETLETNVHNLYRNKIKILKSGLPLNDAAVLGSTALVM
ncbi:ROK family protein [Ekhidna sp.]|uniref:ROK family protein n=1 Tax=Ekhidna sp. TaxID=2608089 RepID=UPI003B5B24AC